MTGLVGYGAAMLAVGFWPSPVDESLSPLLVKVIGKVNEFGIPLTYGAVEWSANVAFFTPLGLLLGLLLGPGRRALAILLGVTASMLIEAGQWALLPARFPSLFDVWANSIGAALGVLVAAFVARLLLKQSAG